MWCKKETSVAITFLFLSKYFVVEDGLTVRWKLEQRMLGEGEQQVELSIYCSSWSWRLRKKDKGRRRRRWVLARRKKTGNDDHRRHKSREQHGRLPCCAENHVTHQRERGVAHYSRSRKKINNRTKRKTSTKT